MTSAPPVREFWEDCYKCENPHNTLELLYTCEGCKCRIWRGTDKWADREYVMVWHGTPARGAGHQLRGRVHTASNCRHWASVDRTPGRADEGRTPRDRA